jgi:hypothetical protein
MKQRLTKIISEKVETQKNKAKCQKKLGKQDTHFVKNKWMK